MAKGGYTYKSLRSGKLRRKSRGKSKTKKIFKSLAGNIRSLLKKSTSKKRRTKRRKNSPRTKRKRRKRRR